MPSPRSYSSADRNREQGQLSADEVRDVLHVVFRVKSFGCDNVHNISTAKTPKRLPTCGAGTGDRPGGEAYCDTLQGDVQKSRAPRAKFQPRCICIGVSVDTHTHTKFLHLHIYVCVGDIYI